MDWGPGPKGSLPAHILCSGLPSAKFAPCHSCAPIPVRTLPPAPAARLLPFPTAPTPLGPPPGLPGAPTNPKAADRAMAGGAASPLPLQAQQEGGAAEFDGVRLMMTSPAG